MNISHLKYALEVERTGSISRAAEALYMSQPHLSKAIRELEESMGITIFSRTPRGVAPTKQGKDFLSYAQNIITQIDEMESMYKKAPENKQKFDICVPRASYIADAFISFLNDFDFKESMDMNYRETNSMETINLVSTGANNLGIIRYQTEMEDYFLNALEERLLKYTPIWEFEYLALMSKSHPLANHKEIDYSELRTCIEIEHGDITVPALPIAKAREMAKLEEEKKRICIYERASQLELLRRIPSTFMWVSPMPKDLMQNLGLVQKKCNMAKNKYKDILIYRKGYRLSHLDRTFSEKLKETINAVSVID